MLIVFVAAAIVLPAAARLKSKSPMSGYYTPTHAALARLHTGVSDEDDTALTTFGSEESSADGYLPSAFNGGATGDAPTTHDEVGGSRVSDGGDSRSSSSSKNADDTAPTTPRGNRRGGGFADRRGRRGGGGSALVIAKSGSTDGTLSSSGGGDWTIDSTEARVDRAGGGGGDEARDAAVLAHGLTANIGPIRPNIAGDGQVAGRDCDSRSRRVDKGASPTHPYLDYARVTSDDDDHDSSSSANRNRGRLFSAPPASSLSLSASSSSDLTESPNNITRVRSRGLHARIAPIRASHQLKLIPLLEMPPPPPPPPSLLPPVQQQRRPRRQSAAPRRSGGDDFFARLREEVAFVRSENVSLLSALDGLAAAVGEHLSASGAALALSGASFTVASTPPSTAEGRSRENDEDGDRAPNSNAANSAPADRVDSLREGLFLHLVRTRERINAIKAGAGKERTRLRRENRRLREEVRLLQRQARAGGGGGSGCSSPAVGAELPGEKERVRTGASGRNSMVEESSTPLLVGPAKTRDDKAEHEVADEVEVGSNVVGFEHSTETGVKGQDPADGDDANNKMDAEQADTADPEPLGEDASKTDEVAQEPMDDTNANKDDETGAEQRSEIDPKPLEVDSTEKVAQAFDDKASDDKEEEEEERSTPYPGSESPYRSVKFAIEGINTAYISSEEGSAGARTTTTASSTDNSTASRDSSEGVGSESSAGEAERVTVFGPSSACTCTHGDEGVAFDNDAIPFDELEACVAAPCSSRAESKAPTGQESSGDRSTTEAVKEGDGVDSSQATAAVESPKCVRVFTACETSEQNEQKEKGVFTSSVKTSAVAHGSELTEGSDDSVESPAADSDQRSVLTTDSVAGESVKVTGTSADGVEQSPPLPVDPRLLVNQVVRLKIQLASAQTDLQTAQHHVRGLCDEKVKLKMQLAETLE